MSLENGRTVTMVRDTVSLVAARYLAQEIPDVSTRNVGFSIHRNGSVIHLVGEFGFDLGFILRWRAPQANADVQAIVMPAPLIATPLVAAEVTAEEEDGGVTDVPGETLGETVRAPPSAHDPLLPAAIGQSNSRSVPPFALDEDTVIRCSSAQIPGGKTSAISLTCWLARVLCCGRTRGSVGAAAWRPSGCADPGVVGDKLHAA